MGEGGKPFLDRLKNKKIIIILISIVLLLALGAACARYLVFNDKPARQLYLESEGKNFRKYSEQIKQIYRDFYSYQKPYMDARYKNRVELTANVKSESENPFGLTNAQDIFDIINRCKLVMDSNTDPAAKKNLTRLSLLVEKAPLIDADVYINHRQAGFSIPVFLPDKYFVCNLDKIDEVYDRYEKRNNLPSFKPKRLIKGVDIATTIRFSDGELDSIISDYGSMLWGLIQDSEVTYGKNVVTRVGTEEVKAREVIVSLGSDRAVKLLKDIAAKISSDDTLLKLTYENYTDVAKLFDEAGLFQIIKLLDDYGCLKLNDTIKGYVEKINAKKDLSTFKSAVKEFGEGTASSEGLKMTLLVDKSGKILDRKLNMVLSNGKNQKSAIEIHSGSNDTKNDNLKNGFCNITLTNTSPNGESEASSWSISTNITPGAKLDSEKGEIKINLTSKKNDKQEFTAQAKLDIDKNTDELTLKKNSLVKYDIGIKGSSSDQEDRLSGEINTVSWKNNKQKTRNANTTLVVNADLPSNNLKNTTLKLDLKKEDRLDIADFSLPDVQGANSVDLNNIPENELLNIEDQMIASFGTFYLKNQGIIDTVLGNR